MTVVGRGKDGKREPGLTVRELPDRRRPPFPFRRFFDILAAGVSGRPPAAGQVLQQ